tara:strand:- start:295 stop:426 length:132 start_codon:yes stop_codon:yes gene_type:complete
MGQIEMVGQKKEKKKKHVDFSIVANLKIVFELHEIKHTKHETK